MSRARIIYILAVFLGSTAGLAAQVARAPFGPVVTAYLTGLREELNELEYQVRRQEISRTDYDRTRERLQLLRRHVERAAARGGEDVVPELLVLAEDEFKNLGVSGERSPAQLTVGETIESRWRLIAIEPVGAPRAAKPGIRFYVFERVASPQTDAVRERRLDRRRNLEAIETVLVQEPVAKPREPQPAAAQPSAPEASPAPPEAPPAPRPQLQLPRILHIYLPEYTDKAREKAVEGELIVRALFQRDGKIKDLKVAKGLGHGLDQRATDAVRRIGFQPASLDGRPMDSRAEIVFEFKLARVSVSVRSSQTDVEN
ncbi:MAG: energy transducer TonB [Blastocatellia bacterium]|nr:energy transducer TonB [Blastocatellia bacterium]